MGGLEGGPCPELVPTCLSPWPEWTCRGHRVSPPQEELDREGDRGTAELGVLLPAPASLEGVLFFLFSASLGLAQCAVKLCQAPGMSALGLDFMEYLQLEETLRDHGVQCPAAHRSTWDSESALQAALELWQLLLCLPAFPGGDFAIRILSLHFSIVQRGVVAGLPGAAPGTHCPVQGSRLP